LPFAGGRSGYGSAENAGGEERGYGGLGQHQRIPPV
jgi:hypothetical protein